MSRKTNLMPCSICGALVDFDWMDAHYQVYHGAQRS